MLFFRQLFGRMTIDHPHLGAAQPDAGCKGRQEPGSINALCGGITQRYQRQGKEVIGRHILVGAAHPCRQFSHASSHAEADT